MNTIIRKIFKPKNDSQSLKDAIEDLMEDHTDERLENGSINDNTHKRSLIANILSLTDKTVEDVMIPRADIIAIEAQESYDSLVKLICEHQFSRYPVYDGQLDDIIGTIHIKDIIAKISENQEIIIRDLVRDIPILSPALTVSELILFMKENRKHMALVVDEYGGIDGLVTLGDIIESIVGEIEDEYDTSTDNLLSQKQDGSILADGRVELEDFEEEFDFKFDEDDHEEADTLGGLVFSIAGRIPARGEIIPHESGLEFEIMDADPRRVSRLKIRNLEKAREKLHQDD